MNNLDLLRSEKQFLYSSRAFEDAGKNLSNYSLNTENCVNKAKTAKSTEVFFSNEDFSARNGPRFFFIFFC